MTYIQNLSFIKIPHRPRKIKRKGSPCGEPSFPRALGLRRNGASLRPSEEPSIPSLPKLIDELVPYTKPDSPVTGPPLAQDHYRVLARCTVPCLEGRNLSRACNDSVIVVDLRAARTHPLSTPDAAMRTQTIEETSERN